MKRFTAFVALVLLAAAAAVSCSKDKDAGKLAFDRPAVFLQPGGTATVGFSSTDIKSYSISSKPVGWDDAIVLDEGAMSVGSPLPPSSKTMPGRTKEPRKRKGGTVGNADPRGNLFRGKRVTATLFVSVSKTVDMSDRPANSYLVNGRECNFTFDAMHKGDGQSALATASVDIVWQSKTNLIQYLSLDDGKVSFYVGADEDEDDRIDEGNALIGAYDADGTLIWSWHVWAADYDPDADGGSVVFNGYTMMNRNLGALANGNETTDEILASYGLYYQWGRKDPFIGPSTYRADNGSSASMYNAKSGTVKLESVESDAETGTADYAVQHPLEYITGTADSDYDWAWSHDGALWGESKTVNDPCPYGWRVAPSEAFEGLTISGTPAAADYDKFGWTLTDGTSQSFFVGAGRRRYDNGTILNIYNPVPAEAQSRNTATEAPAVGGPLLDFRRRFGSAVARFLFLVREEDLRRQCRVRSTLCPCQRNAGALREGEISGGSLRAMKSGTA